MVVITDRQREICDFIAEHIADHGYPPSVREIGDHVGLSSPSSVHHHLRRLEEAGALVRIAGRSRATTLAVPISADIPSSPEAA